MVEGAGQAVCVAGSWRRSLAKRLINLTGCTTFPLSFSLSAVPSSPPESPQCDVLGSTSIYITWSPPDIDGQNGKIKGYKVFYISVDELYGKSVIPSPPLLPLSPLFPCYPVCLVPNCLARKLL